jgi:ABC-type multidrug transport system fused ATPase/permease subunit
MNQAEDKPTLFKLCFWVGTCAWRRLGLLAWVAISMLFQILFEVLKPWPVLFLVDYILMGKVLPGPWLVWVERLPGAPAAPALIGWTIGSTILIFLMSWATNLANGLASISLGQRMVYDLAAELFAKLQQLSLRFHAHRSVGDNIRRIMADSNCVAVIATEALLPVLSALISLVVMFGIMWQVAPGLTMVALAVVPYKVWVFYRYARPMLELSYRQQDEESEIYSLYEESLSAMPLVQSFGREALNQ